MQPYFQALSKHLLPEIESLADKRANEEGLGNFSIPLAAILFSMIDLLGYLIRKDTETDTPQNFRILLLNDSYFPNSYRSEDVELVIKIYRHSITHTVFPRATAEIGKYEKEPNLIIRDGNQLILNVHVLAKDFINAYAKIILRIEQSDEDLIKTISTRFKKMRDDDYKKYADTIKYYEACQLNRNMNKNPVKYRDRLELYKELDKSYSWNKNSMKWE